MTMTSPLPRRSGGESPEEGSATCRGAGC
uniref:Uncharacterized protein n=1 Tax=Anguilla anguilla TaxID=7936 RepID=A0A0E9VEF5_ANGAN